MAGNISWTEEAREAARAAKDASRPFKVLQKTGDNSYKVLASYWSPRKAREHPEGTHIAQTREHREGTAWGEHWHGDRPRGADGRWSRRRVLMGRAAWCGRRSFSGEFGGPKRVLKSARASRGHKK